jgi:hypothetical protein
MRVSATGLQATGDVIIPDKIVHDGDTNTAIRFPAADTVTVETAGSERMRIDSSGNVIIGETSTINGGNLNVATSAADATISALCRSTTDSEGVTLVFQKSSTNSGNFAATGDGENLGKILFRGVNTSAVSDIGAQISVVQNGTSASTVPANMIFSTNESERMRIDSSGNVLVGKTSSAFGTAGVELQSSGQSLFTRSGNTPVSINRLSDNGNLLAFSKDGATVGSLGIESSGFVLDGEGSHAGLKMFASAIGSRQNGSDVDATIDLGYSGGRFKDGYFSGTVDAGAFTDDDGKIRAIPQSGSDKTSSYTLTTGDVGNFIGIGSGGSITVPNSTFSAGDAVSIFNNTSGDRTITLSISTAYIAGENSDKNSVTLATRGVCTILFISGTVCVLSGNVS